MEASTSAAALAIIDQQDQLEDEEVINNRNSGEGEVEGTGLGDGDDDDFAPPPAAAGSAAKGKKRSNKRGAAEDEDEDANKKKRNRKPVTCAQCRRRKLKCDRGYPCGACRDRQEAHLCDWGDAVRLPQPHLTRDAEAQELRGQLDRFENLLKALSSGNPIPVGSTSASVFEGASSSASGDISTAPGPFPLAGTSAATAGSTGDETVLARSLNNLQKPNATGAKTANSNSRAQLLANAASVGHLVGLLPSRRELDILITRFLTSEPNFLPIVHVPTFNIRYNAFTHATASEDPFMLAFLFAIVSYEMGWQLTDPELSRTAAVQKEGAMKRLFEAASEGLRMAGHHESPNLDVVRTLIVLYSCSSQQLDSRAGFILTQAIQVAQTLGLHRDPSAVGITDMVEAEERRRLWHILVALDSLDQPGRFSIITADDYDTRAPASAYDTDITQQRITSRPFPTFTPSLYTELIQKIGSYNTLITEHFFSVKPKEPISWSRITESNAGLDRLKVSFPALEWKNGLVEPLSEDSFASDRFRVLAHTALLKLEIRVNRPFLTRGFVDVRFAASRERVLDAAEALLGIWLAYPMQSQVSRLWQLAYHGLNAMCILIVDLFQDPRGPRAESHRKFLTSAAGRIDRPEYKSPIAQEVVRIANVLMSHLGGRQTPTPVPLASLDPGEQFTVSSLPVPMTIDPFAHVSPSPFENDSTQDPELATLWHELVASHPTMYAVPDKVEWRELCKPPSDMWRNGTELVSNPAQTIDVVAE